MMWTSSVRDLDQEIGKEHHAGPGWCAVRPSSRKWSRSSYRGRLEPDDVGGLGLEVGLGGWPCSAPPDGAGCRSSSRPVRGHMRRSKLPSGASARRVRMQPRVGGHTCRTAAQFGVGTPLHAWNARDQHRDVRCRVTSDSARTKVATAHAVSCPLPAGSRAELRSAVARRYCRGRGSSSATISA
jgi:hypothetical protein